MVTYDFHPEVRADLDEIWQFIAADNPDAADRMIAEIVEAIDNLESSLTACVMRFRCRRAVPMPF